MEKMGDKDIVRRAFKSFQNRANRSSGGENSNTPKQVYNLILNCRFTFHGSSIYAIVLCLL